jgi:hypothetical protein
VLVGDASAFVKQLPGAGFDSYDVIPASDLDLFAPDLRRKAVPSRGGYRPVAKWQSVKNPKSDAAKPILDKAIAAKGGLAKLRAIQTVRAETTTTVHAQGNPVTFGSTTWIQYPDRFRVDADMPGGTIAQVYADGRYWIADAKGAKEMPEEGRGPLQAAIARDTIHLLLKAGAGELVVREIDSDDPLLAAIEVSGGGAGPIALFVNRDSGLIERARYASATQGRMEELYSDYRPVHDVRCAFPTFLPPLGPGVERDVKTSPGVPLPRLFLKPGS